MNWRVVFHPAVEHDVATAAAWYESRQPGLGAAFVGEALATWHALAENPLLPCRQPHPDKQVRWRLTNRFPYRVVYEVQPEQQTVIVVCVIHAARHHRHWAGRI